MSGRSVRSVLSLALGGVVVASPAFASPMVLHTGTIVAENMKHDTITIEEMGPWHGPEKPLPLVRRQFHLTSRTVVALAARKDEPGGLKGAFIDQPLKATDLRPGDYATVTAERENGKLVATKVEIVRLDERAVVPARPQ
ncbi:MAG TPA: hypothetical protein VMI34_15945 [Candidatus Bathyarchaeia archaeon]|nr:hypothetical protein [Candidatus Bathyarchaeia archaeon]